MRGSPSIEKKAAPLNSVTKCLSLGTNGPFSRTKSQSLRMLIAPLAVGVIAGLVISNFRLHLGLSGHKAIFWMTPVLLARFLGRCPAGATAGALATAFTCLALGGNIAGGLIGLPLVGLVGILFDVVIGHIEKRKQSILAAIPLLALCTMSANLIMFGKRSLSPMGMAPDAFWGYAGFWFHFFSYTFFGLAAGMLAVFGAYLYHRCSKDSSKRS
jgi:hypothetical protein